MLRAAKRRGLPCPALDQMPELFASNQWVYEGFFQLCGSRPITMSGGFAPVPVSEICAWLELNGIHDLDDRTTFLRLIQALDAAWLKRMNPSGDA
jgi:hypothetical protein